MRASLADTESAKEVYEAIKRGDLNGMSFAFKVNPGDDSYDVRTNTRTIKKISKLMEVSVVPFPAYSQTSVEARSAMNDSISRFNKIKTAKLLINQILKVEF
jgi:HK97 family phage prohead protease